jgi:hypothetical protein
MDGARRRDQRYEKKGSSAVTRNPSAPLQLHFHARFLGNPSHSPAKVQHTPPWLRQVARAKQRCEPAFSDGNRLPSYADKTGSALSFHLDDHKVGPDQPDPSSFSPFATQRECRAPHSSSGVYTSFCCRRPIPLRPPPLLSMLGAASRAFWELEAPILDPALASLDLLLLQLGRRLKTAASSPLLSRGIGMPGAAGAKVACKGAAWSGGATIGPSISTSTAGARGILEGRCLASSYSRRNSQRPVI